MGLTGQDCAHVPPAWIAATAATAPHNACHRPRITHLPEERRTVNDLRGQCNPAGRSAVNRWSDPVAVATRNSALEPRPLNLESRVTSPESRWFWARLPPDARS